MLTLSVNQPCYLPWCGLFERIDRADVHVHLDDVQYVRQTFFNRNKVLDRAGQDILLTVPVSAHLGQTFVQVKMAGKDWVRKHTTTLEQCYGRTARATVLSQLCGWIAEDAESLAELNIRITNGLCAALGIDTPMYRASHLGVAGEATTRLIELCRHFGASTYYSPAGARQYIEEDLFRAAGIALVYQDYQPVPYAQDGRETFVSHLSVVDVLLRQEAEAALQIIRAGARGG